MEPGAACAAQLRVCEAAGNLPKTTSVDEAGHAEAALLATCPQNSESPGCRNESAGA